MKQLIKQKISKILIIIIAIAIIFSLDINIKQVKAATLNSKEYYDLYSTQGMIMKEGCLIIPSKGKTASSNYRYRAIGYNLTITKNGVSTTKYMSKSTYDKGPGNLTSGRYTYKTTIFTKEDIESVFGIDLDTGSISIVSNARMEAYNASTGEVYITNLNSWSDWTSLNKWPGDAICDALEPYRTEFYNKTVYWENYKLTVNKGTGIASTSGSGWYKPNTSISYKGTAANGYNSPTSGSIKMPYNNKTVTVSATPNKLTIKFKMNGGNIGGSTADKTQTMSYGTHYKVTYTPSRTGYNFKGWGKSGSNTIYIYPSSATSGVKINTKYAAKGWGDHLGASISAHSNNSVTLEAKWTAKKYTVSYNSNKPTSASTIPTGSMSNQTATYNNNFKTNKNKFALVGYEFTGWNEKANNQGTAWNKNTTGTYENGTAWKWTYTKNITLYAQWKAKNYTITFHPNEGYFSGNSTNVTKSQTVTFDSTSNNSFTTIPLRTGYTFKGWHTSKTGGTQVYYSNGNCIAGTSYWNSSKKWIYANNLTVYAHWTPNTYDLTIDPNGGTMYNGDNTTTSSFTTKFVYDRKTYIGNLSSNNTGRKENAPIRTGYDFTGFKFSGGTGGQNTAGNTFYFSNTNVPANTTETYIFNGNYAGNVTATAQWRAKNYTITFDPNFGKWTDQTGNKELIVTYDSTNNNTLSTEFENLSRDGAYIATADKLDFYTKNSEGSLSTPLYNNGNYVSGTYFSDSKYYFVINNIGTSGPGFWKYANDVTVYPKWTNRTLTIKYNSNGGNFNDGTTTKSSSPLNYYSSVNTSNTQTQYTLEYNTNNTIPTKEGYTFKGWGLSPNYGVEYEYNTTYKDTVQNFATKIDANGIKNENRELTLYAQWEKTVTYNFNYFNESTQKEQISTLKVTYRNSDSNIKVTSFINGKTYITSGDKTIATINDNGGISIKHITGSRTINGDLYNLNGLSLSANSTAPRYNNTGESTETLTLNASGNSTVNFYTSYYRNPTIKLYEISGSVKAIKTINANTSYKNLISNGLIAGINDKQTVQNQQSVYVNYKGELDEKIKLIFTFPEQATMKYAEKNAAGTLVSETWTNMGWTLSTQIKSQADYGINTAYKTYSTYDDQVFYALYSKNVTLTVEGNGGTMNSQKTMTNSIVRYVNAANINSIKNQQVPLYHGVYLNNNNNYVYSFVTYTYKQLEPNSKIIVTSEINNGIAKNNGMNNTPAYTGTADKSETINKKRIIYYYTPLVTETIYAAWSNKPIPEIEPEVTVNKTAKWYNATISDTATYDFDARGDINLDGIVEVTLTVNIKNQNNTTAKDIYVLDYFNKDIWDYYSNITPKLSANVNNYKRENNKITYTITNNAEGEFIVKYYLKLQEAYWKQDASGDFINNTKEIKVNQNQSLGKEYSEYKNNQLYYKYYINKIKQGDLNKYLTDELYYSTSDKSKKAYVWVDYNINGGLRDEEHRQIHNKSAYVEMRQINLIPTVSLIPEDENSNNKVGISVSGSDLNKNDKSATNKNSSNFYKDYTTNVNTYYIKYNTKGDYVSYFDVKMASQLKRSYSYYQISNNLFDVVSGNRKQIIDNIIPVSPNKDNSSTDFDDNLLNTNNLLNVKQSYTVHSSVLTNKVSYINGAASTKTTLSAINENGLKIIMYPFIKTKNTQTNKVYKTDNDVSKRLELIVDAEEPIVIPDGKMVTANNGSEKAAWNEYVKYCNKNNIKSDGYVDVNLINTATNKTGSVESDINKSYTYTFNLHDKVSGISNPKNNVQDWIDTIHDNVQVTLVRVDDNKELFNSEKDPNYTKNYIKVTYNTNTTSSINKDAQVKLTLDGQNPDMWGHLQLKIRVYDNVFNYTDKVYDFYVFNFTANVSLVETIIQSDPVRANNVTAFLNGEQGQVNISANGFVDRVTVKFTDKMNQDYINDYNKIYNKFNNDVATTINGDYPNDDYTSKSYIEANDPFKASKLYSVKDNKLILPNGCQSVYWGYEVGEYGGLKLSAVETSTKTEATIDTSMLPIKTTLKTLINSYLNINNFGNATEPINGTYGEYNYLIMDNKLYINYSERPDGTIIAEYVVYVATSEILYGVEYVPTTLSVNGVVNIPITYKNVNVTNTMSLKDKITAIKNGATIETKVTYSYSLTNWVTDENGSSVKPLIHYFYVPLHSQKNENNVITLTAYQGSETGYPHSTTIQLIFSNDSNGDMDTILDNLNTIIKDN